MTSNTCRGSVIDQCFTPEWVVWKIKDSEKRHLQNVMCLVRKIYTAEIFTDLADETINTAGGRFRMRS